MEVGLLSGALIILLLSIAFTQFRIESRLGAQEAKIAKLLAHLGVDLDTPSEPSDTVKELAKTPGQYIAAITAYRKQTGAGLKEAKAVIDNLAQVTSSPDI